MKIFYALCVSLLTLSTFGQSQEVSEIQRHLLESDSELRPADVQNLTLTSEFTSEHNGVKHLYYQQSHAGKRVKNSNINAAFDRNGRLVSVAPVICRNLAAKADADEASFDLNAGIERALSDLGIQANFTSSPTQPNGYDVQLSGENYTHTCKAELVYWHTPEDELKLAWEFDVDLPDETHWWQYVISAVDGSVIAKFDIQLNCTPTLHLAGGCTHFENKTSEMELTTLDGSSYRAFPFPVESPSHGERDLIVEPADPLASPFGWHDTDGFNGAEYTITRGNNVYAYEDEIDADAPGFSPDGGEELDFDFPLDLAQGPETYQEASITNLFYANNAVHDILYAYGFTEQAGNFQENNYFNGGLGSDPVNAEAQDGEGFNNANMATPEEGQNPRMQMYLWNVAQSESGFTINSPEAIAGTYLATGSAAFGPDFPAGGLTGDLVVALDGDGSENDVCSEVINPGEVAGKIALVRRGGCTFVDKVLNAQEAGAIGVVVVNNIVGGGVDAMGGVSSDVEIPSLMIEYETGELISDALENGDTVNATAELISSAVKDGSFDNGIVIHEYIHGLTNRLTGGAFNVFCLFNEEQMGEGWSDWYAIMMTLDPDGENPTYRPIGTFATGEPVTGVGIRPVAYDTSFAVNDYTYADVSNDNLSVPHGVGFVWATMLWDLTWAFIDEYGFDPDLINGDGGNTRVLQLVTDALTLQSCNPGFVDGRDAILLADELLYDGANECLIWEVFARRGLGLSASQGSSNSRSDGTAAFDIPAICQEVFNPPTASFSVNNEVTCTGIVQFTDESTDIPQEWLWDFGDGNTSEEQNPTHQYEEEGSYTVSLTVSNALGEDETVQTDLIVYETPEMPDAEGAAGCSGEEVVLTASSNDGNDVRWLDESFQEVGQGTSLNVTLSDASESYFAQAFSELPTSEFVGPEDNDFGTGGNHATGFIGTIDFEVLSPLTIESALVISGATGTRTINLYPEASGNGTPIQSVTVDVDFTGADRIELGFTITEPGIYSIGLSQANFYRNDSGADYPYEDEEGVFTIIGGSAGPDYYYYFYDVEVIAGGCLSDPVEVVAEVTGDADFSFEDNGLEVSFTDESAGGSSWFWEFGDGSTSTEQNPIHTYGAPGTYSVTLTVDDGCSVTFEVSVGTTNIDEAENGSGFAVFPNPSDGRFFITNASNDDGVMELRIIDVSGKQVHAEVMAGERTEIDLSALSGGVYFLRVLKENEVIHRDKITLTD